MGHCWFWSTPGVSPWNFDLSFLHQWFTKMPLLLLSSICWWSEDLSHHLRWQRSHWITTRHRFLLFWTTSNGLSLNTAKCKVLHLGANNKKYSYHLAHNPILSTNQIRDLGVIIDSNLKFHVQALTASSKARRTGNYLLKHLSFVNCKMLKILINSFIRPHLEYCIQAWRPFYQKSFSVLERTFRHFTKRCHSTAQLPYHDRLNILGLTSLSARFDRGDMLQTFKILHGHDCLHANDFFSMASHLTNRGHPLKIQPQTFRTNLRKGAFSQRVVMPWNKLPSAIVLASSVNSWKSLFDKFSTE